MDIFYANFDLPKFKIGVETQSYVQTQKMIMKKIFREGTNDKQSVLPITC